MGNMAAVYEALKHSDDPIALGFADEANGTWYAVHTEPMKERQVLTDLCAGGVSAYMPVAPVTRRLRGSRWTRTFQPMLRCYVLLRSRAIEDCHHFVRNTNGVLDFLCLAHPGEFRAPAAIDANLVGLLALKEAELKRSVQTLHIGQDVEVVEGIWAGFKGQVEKLLSDSRISVGIEGNGRVIPIEVDTFMLRAV